MYRSSRETMANFLLNLPNSFRAVSVSASTSSNGSPPTVPQQGGPVILELPLDKIRRPLMRTRSNDPQKVKELMDSISEIGLQVPVSSISPSFCDVACHVEAMQKDLARC